MLRTALTVALFSAVALSAASKTSLAAPPEIRITSFRYADSRTRAAELCAKVVETPEIPTARFVKVVVDPKGKKPGIYNTIVGSEGEFCVTVMTYDGVAEATLRGSSGEPSVASAEAARAPDPGMQR